MTRARRAHTLLLKPAARPCLGAGLVTDVHICNDGGQAGSKRLELTLGILAALLWGVLAVGCSVMTTGSSQMHGSGVRWWGCCWRMRVEWCRSVARGTNHRWVQWNRPMTDGGTWSRLTRSCGISGWQWALSWLHKRHVQGQGSVSG